MCFVSARLKEEDPLDIFFIYFDTVTYDNIEKDVKMTFTAYIGLIGGNMGFFAGFSILRKYIMKIDK